MSALKMFFCIISENKNIEVTVHRELSSIYTSWCNQTLSDKVGIIHIGFIRPKLPPFEDLEQFNNNILVTKSVKWALPGEYITSNKVVNNIVVPLYLLLSGFGYDLKIDDDEIVSETHISNINNELDDANTIALAALDVLRSTSKYMSKEEIYGHLVEKGLYKFSVNNPVRLLKEILDRYCVSNFSLPDEKLFGKSNDDLFYPLCEGVKFSGWLKTLEGTNSKLVEECRCLGVFDDSSFIAKRNEFSVQVGCDLDLIRFNLLKTSIDLNDPSQLIPILPQPILNANISQLGLSVRNYNVLRAQNIFSLKDAIGISLSEMSKWPNFGIKSSMDLCKLLLKHIDNKNYLFLSLKQEGLDVEQLKSPSENDTDFHEAVSKNALDNVQQIPLKQHVENTLAKMNDKSRIIFEYRTGYRGSVKTLEEVSHIVGLTRERVRQIQKRCVEQIVSLECWDDCIAVKIGNLLRVRTEPLYLEMLELEDKWFAGFMGNYVHLAAIIDLFSENQINILTINGAVVISRISQDDWNILINDFRHSLKIKADEQQWFKKDIDLTFRSELERKSALELLPILWDSFNDTLQFSSEDETLISFGKTGESAVFAVLQQAEGPLHFSEVARRATEIFGRKVEDRLAHSSLPRLGAKLFGRGIYGFAKFNPISELTCKNIRLVVIKLLYEGPLAKQWHVTEILSFLKDKFPSLPLALDTYILNIILEECVELTYLNKNVWARADSGQKPTDRVDMADAFTKILEDAGRPLKGKELKARLEAIRGVHESLQIQPNEMMLQVGPDEWGLLERDVKIGYESISKYLDSLYTYLHNQQKGIHVTEVTKFLDWANLGLELPESYTLISLAQKDDRFYLGRAMFLGLSEWGDDTRRYTYSQAVRKVLDEMTVPISIIEINAKVQNLTGLDTDSSMTSILIAEGAKYDKKQRLWFKQ